MKVVYRDNRITLLSTADGIAQGHFNYDDYTWPVFIIRGAGKRSMAVYVVFGMKVRRIYSKGWEV